MTSTDDGDDGDDGDEDDEEEAAATCADGWMRRRMGKGAASARPPLGQWGFGRWSGLVCL